MSPEIMFWWPPGDDLAMRGWVVPLDDYLARPNPYVAGNERWRDLILPLTIEPPWQAQDGHIYHLPLDLFLTALFYNKGILAEAGIERMPGTWAEFTEALRRIQKAGYEPFWCSVLWSVWPRALLGDYLYDDEVFRKLDVLTPNDRIDPEEGVRGAYLGITGVHEPRFREYMRLMKEWAKYWKWGFSFNRTTDSIDLFRTNRLAFRWDSALNLTEYLIDPYMKFEFGVTWFPAMTIETSPLASGRTPVVRAVPGNSYYISRTAADRGLVDLCVDWLMFLTTPEHSTRLTQEATGVKVPSAIVGAGIDLSLEPLMDFDLGFKHHLEIPWAATPESVDNCDRIFELYLMDQVTMEEAISRMAKWMKAGVEEAIRINQRLPNPADRWDLSRW
jgi:ABC-type glycerol-3-phosphate transport system substrate-binding protein